MLHLQFVMFGPAQKQISSDSPADTLEHGALEFAALGPDKVSRASNDAGTIRTFFILMFPVYIRSQTSFTLPNFFAGLISRDHPAMAISHVWTEAVADELGFPA